MYEIAIEHARLYEQTYNQEEKFWFLPMRKHLGWYIQSIPHASEIRQAIYQTNSSEEARAVFERFDLLPPQ